MNRDMLQKHLEQTEEHIARSEKHLVDQRALIARLEREGYADQAAEAKQLLTHLEDTHRLHLADRDRIQRELELDR